MSSQSTDAKGPSLTVWTRIEPWPRDGSLAAGLAARVRDALWMLGRQWQVGEFQGDDAGSPVQAAFRCEYAPLTSYRPQGGPAVPLDAELPLEVQVERQAVRLELRGAMQLGLRFEAILREQAPPGEAPRLTQAFRDAYPVGAAPDAAEVPDADGRLLRAAVAGRVTNGNALYGEAVPALASRTLPPSLANAASRLGIPAAGLLAAVLPALQTFADFVAALYSQPATDTAWSPGPPAADGSSEIGRLRYRFAVGSEVAGDDLAFTAPDFPGGHLDWYDFSLAADRVGAGDPSAATVKSRTLMPHHVTFPGMPAGRWWTFEDGRADLGRLDSEVVDLAQLLVMEFALLYGNDWFTVPLRLPTGSRARIRTLVVTDTFGQATLIRPTAAQAPPLAKPWRMFTVSGGQGEADILLLPPTLGATSDGPALEVVDLLRDDGAAMGWAVERTLQGPLDDPVDGYESDLAGLKREEAPGPPPPAGDTPAIVYRLGASVPGNWIPLLPEVRVPGSAPFLRRGAMLRPAADPGTGRPTWRPVPPRGQILQPGYPAPANPLFLADQAVPRTGVQVSRSFRRARWIDGSTRLWLAYRVRPGRGTGESGLAFDLIEPGGRAAGHAG